MSNRSAGLKVTLIQPSEVTLKRFITSKTLMQQLSLAKKEQDTFAMLMLAQSYLPDFELNMDKQTLAGLEYSLKEKIFQLNQAHQQMQQGQTLKSMVWQRFGGGSKQAREKAIQQYVSDLHHEVEQLQGQISELKTVQQMQLALRERSNQNTMFDVLEKLFMEGH
ncbi:MAG: hypothetical protein ACK5MF_05950 [Vibrio sp.]|uniref:hypothetical protein n=1 Tax=Vibrio sp. TaxID=678 RepID=UPI003A85A9AB